MAVPRLGAWLKKIHPADVFQAQGGAAVITGRQSVDGAIS